MSYAIPAPWTAPRDWTTSGPFGRRGGRPVPPWARMSETGSDDTNTDRQESAEGRGRRHHGHRGRGPGGPGFGPGPWGGRGPWGPPRGRRRERGDVRAAILLLLAEQPRHGYEILTELADRSDGQWQPSPGSIYPVLKRLAREGLVLPSHEEGKRVFSLTDEGRAVVEAERAGWGEPWAQATNPDSEAAMDLWTEGNQLGAAVWQMAQTGEPEQIEAAVAVLAEARKKIYGLLAG